MKDKVGEVLALCPMDVLNLDQPDQPPPERCSEGEKHYDHPFPHSFF